jgi:hypothetical protein
MLELIKDAMRPFSLAIVMGYKVLFCACIRTDYTASLAVHREKEILQECQLCANLL